MAGRTRSTYQRAGLWLALVALGVFSVGCQRPDPPNPIIEGQQLYTIYCLGCHSLSADNPLRSVHH